MCSSLRAVSNEVLPPARATGPTGLGALAQDGWPASDGQVAWIAFNAFVLARHAFDPYPFIFLNLMLSMVAALQAPIIMMSQNRQSAKDRLEDRIDYETNAHAAAEIDQVQEKLDLLLDILISDNQVRARALELMARSKIN